MKHFNDFVVEIGISVNFFQIFQFLRPVLQFYHQILVETLSLELGLFELHCFYFISLFIDIALPATQGRVINVAFNSSLYMHRFNLFVSSILHHGWISELHQISKLSHPMQIAKSIIVLKIVTTWLLGVLA